MFYRNLILLGTCLLTFTRCQPIESVEKDGNPCRAAKLEVHARNVETGDWSVKLGDIEGEISHHAEGGTEDEEDSGQWHAGVYNNGYGCGDESSEEIFETEGPIETVETEGPTDEVDTETEPNITHPDYTHFTGIGSYKFHDDFETWEHAKQTCEHEGAHLVVIDSDEELDAIFQLIISPYGGDRHHLSKYDGYDQCFIGARSEDGSTNYVTVLGTTLEPTNYLPWGPGEPSTDWGQEDCIALLYTLKLNNENCHRRMPFICEIEDSF